MECILSQPLLVNKVSTIKMNLIASPDIFRQLSIDQLHGALFHARQMTKWYWKQWRTITQDLRATLPLHDEWNPPEWEAGHIAWFQEFWIARNPDRSMGWEADPNQVRLSSLMQDSDLLYHSSLISHDPRWSLPLPSPDQLEQYLDDTLAQTLRLLEKLKEEAGASQSDRTLYFFRLALYHELMHAEAAIYSINHYLHDMDLELDERNPEFNRFRHLPQEAHFGYATERTELNIEPAERTFGAHHSMGFAFDNECPSFTRTLPAFSIDCQPVSVGQYLGFIQAGGYQDPRFWSEEGWNWKIQGPSQLPRFHRLNAGKLERCYMGRWQVVALNSPILHINAYEAEAWCAWAERRLPTEDEWTVAALECPHSFLWGQVWEWTQSEFLPFHGFQAHPYVDYSQPWFAGHRVLKGASFATHIGMRHPVYRNFYVPSRNDIYAGFRTCAR